MSTSVTYPWEHFSVDKHHAVFTSHPPPLNPHTLFSPVVLIHVRKVESWHVRHDESSAAISFSTTGGDTSVKRGASAGARAGAGLGWQ